MRILTASDLQSSITMREAIDAVREGFIALSTGRARVPLRNVLSAPEGMTLFMPAYLQGSTFSMVKVVSVYPQNARFGLPNILASVLVLDAETGQPRALLDGTYLTALRTGAASGLATELLARPDAATLGMIGAGGQAYMQVAAICAVRPIHEVRIYSRSAEKAMKLSERLQSNFPTIAFRAVPSAAEALHNVEVMVAVTTASTPVIFAEDVAPGTHINGVGSYIPTMQEIAADVVTQSRIVVDSREGCLAEAGDLLIPIQNGQLTIDTIHAEIGEVAAGLKPGRETADQITFFKSVGNAVQDAAVATRIVVAAEKHGVGTAVNF